VAVTAAAAFEQALGHVFRDSRLLAQALTHPSLQARPGGARTDYERLEFLGDRVLGLVIAELLYHRFDAEPEGALAKRLAVLVRREALAEVAGAIGLDQVIQLARGEEDSGGRANPAILADACEAVIGALYLDGGLAPARAFIERWWLPLVASASQPPQDAKTALQEWAQGAGLALPVYRILSAEGPPHDPVFAIEVSISGHSPEVGRGRSKRVAEQAAASALIGRLRSAGAAKEHK
jgi:ribonuclease III